MNAWIPVWLFFRAVRWLSIIVFVGFSLLFLKDRAPYITPFGHLQHWVEAVFFLSGVGFNIAGLLELATREKAGLPRPALGELIPRPVKQ